MPIRRLEQKATVVHRELELVDQELRAAGGFDLGVGWQSASVFYNKMNSHGS